MRKLILLAIFTMFSLASHADALPSYFNLIDEGKAPPAKSQIWGTCWAFSSVYSMESSLHSESAWNQLQFEPKRLSPYHMDKFSGFARKGHQSHVNDTWYSGQGKNYNGTNGDDLDNGLVVHLGGDYFVAAAYLANMGGAVSAWSLPLLSYTNNPHDRFTTIEKYSPRYQKYIPKSIEWLDLSDSNNVVQLKDAILKNGVVSTLQYMEEKPISHTHLGREIHYYGGAKKPNHALNIVGWNDDIAIPPLRRGAWIVVDSDHIDSNEQHIGQFYISYADKYVGSSNEHGPVQFKGVHNTTFNKVYFHSRHGWSYNFSSTKKIKNRYKFDSTETIDSVGFYQVHSGDSLLIEVVGNSGSEVCKAKRISFENRGFYLEKLDCIPYKGIVDVVISSKSKEYATDGTRLFNLLLNGGDSSLPKQGEPVLVRSSARPGESFYMKNGVWYDLYNYKWPKLLVEGQNITRDRSANFSINLYTKTETRNE